jgi:hypothetical protein
MAYYVVSLTKTVTSHVEIFAGSADEAAELVRKDINTGKDDEITREADANRDEECWELTDTEESY